MRAILRWLTKPVILLGILTLPGMGCTQQRDNDTGDATTSSSSTTAGPAAFVAEARSMPFGNKDLLVASKGELLRLGNVVCDGLGIERLGFRRVVLRLVQSEARPTPTEASALVTIAVRHLCPGHASAVERRPGSTLAWPTTGRVD